ncbi:WD40-repeat-containing domain protein [Crepidotus variabilis]|uniref:WD40-repeat-containing domain protein n=1 Tax=Crepidotus variabilis TaxID=179855 RepID=A0A9P6JTJ0_9AGAR|nr:WD40-repeat-containing domain protein [Crepidotus variabilis]
MATPIVICSDEINCLIYSYFQDAGFNHSAFALRSEGRLQSSPYFSKHIRRGELIELLTKSLLYLEVESHWRGDELSTNCRSSFSLLEEHVCSTEEPTSIPKPVDELTSRRINAVNGTSSSVARPSKNGQALDTKVAVRRDGTASSDTPVHEQVLNSQKQSLATSILEGANSKRKTSPVPTDDGHVDKRQRRASTDMDVDQAASQSAERREDSASYDGFTGEKYVTKAYVRPQGPGDKTDPRVALMLAGHKSEVFVCAFNPIYHNLLASGSKDSVVNLWNLPDPPAEGFAEAPNLPIALEQISKAEQGDLTSLDWNPDGTLLAIGSYDSILRVCSVEGGVYFTHPQHQGPIFATRFSKNGAWLLTASLDGTTCLWHVKEKRLQRQYRCHKGGHCCLDVEWLNEETFASAGADQRIFIMRVDEDEPIKMLHGHRDEINQIRVNPSGTRLASCSDDGTAYIWRVDNLKRDADEIPGLSASDHVVILRGHTHSVSTIGWCVDKPTGANEMIATSSFDGTARLWDSVTGQCLHTFKDHKRPLYALEFSPDGRFLATGSGDGWLHIYSSRSYTRLFSWFAGTEKPGVFEIAWQEDQGINRIAVALECREVAVIDISKIDVFQQVLEKENLLLGS